MLTATKLKSLKPRERTYKVFDELGLYLIVRPSKRHWWRFRYHKDGSERSLSFGVYPEVTLKEAREKRDAARNLVANGFDPSQQRKAEKQAGLNEAAGTFKAVAEEWLEAGCPGKRSKGRPSEETIKQLRQRLNKYVYSRIGHIPMSKLDLADLRGVITPISKRGKHETAHRIRSLCERVFG